MHFESKTLGQQHSDVQQAYLLSTTMVLRKKQASLVSQASSKPFLLCSVYIPAATNYVLTAWQGLQLPGAPRSTASPIVVVTHSAYAQHSLPIAVT